MEGRRGLVLRCHFRSQLELRISCVKGHFRELPKAKPACTCMCLCSLFKRTGFKLVATLEKNPQSSKLGVSVHRGNGGVWNFTQIHKNKQGQKTKQTKKKVERCPAVPWTERCTAVRSSVQRCPGWSGVQRCPAVSQLEPCPAVPRAALPAQGRAGLHRWQQEAKEAASSHVAAFTAQFSVTPEFVEPFGWSGWLCAASGLCETAGSLRAALGRAELHQLGVSWPPKAHVLPEDGNKAAAWPVPGACGWWTPVMLSASCGQPAVCPGRLGSAAVTWGQRPVVWRIKQLRWDPNQNPAPAIKQKKER